MNIAANVVSRASMKRTRGDRHFFVTSSFTARTRDRSYRQRADGLNKSDEFIIAVISGMTI